MLSWSNFYVFQVTKSWSWNLEINQYLVYWSLVDSGLLCEENEVLANQNMNRVIQQWQCHYSAAAAAACEALLEMEGHMLGNRSSLGERQGHWLTYSLTQSLTVNLCFRHCTVATSQDGSIFRMPGSEACDTICLNLKEFCENDCWSQNNTQKL